jgi:O-antigen ligase
MKNFILYNSIIYKFSKLIFKSLNTIYLESFLFKLIDKFIIVFKESTLYSNSKEFSEATPKYMYSNTFKLINFFIDKIENLFIFISDILHNIYIYSLIYKVLSFFKNIFKFCKNSVLLVYFSKLKYHHSLYILSFYIFIDFIIRNYTTLSILQSSWDELLFLVMFFILILKWFKERKKPLYKWTPLEFPIIFFMLCCLFEVFFTTPDILIGIEGFRVIFEYILCYFITIQLINSKLIAKMILYILLTVGTIIGLHGIYQYIIAVEIPSKWVDGSENVRTRVFSIIGSPNILGSLMILLIPISISFIFAETKKSKKFLAFLSSLIMLFCLIFTMSRGAWFGLIFALIIYVIIKDKRFIIPLIIFSILAVILVPPITTRINFLFSETYIEKSSKDGRIYRYINGLEKLKEKPLTGVGIGHFGGAVAENNNIKDTYYMDNYVLKTAVEAGIIGLTFFLIMVYNSIIWGFRILKKLKTSEIYFYKITQGILAGMCGVIFHNFFENIFEVPFMVSYYWILTAIIIYLGYINKSNNLTPLK